MGMKKNMVILPLTTTILLFLLLSVTPTRATDEAEKVLDNEGNPLEVGSEYYIRSGRIGWRGGITTSPRPGQFGCPLYVIQSPSNVDPGTPVKFLPDPELKETSHIHLSSKLQIDSGFSAYCRDDGLWRLQLDAWSRRSIVIASGTFDMIPRAWFTIEVADEDVMGRTYKIATGHGYLSVSRDISGLNVLGVTSTNPEPFVFFKKKTDDDDSVIRSATI